MNDLQQWINDMHYMEKVSWFVLKPVAVVLTIVAFTII